MSATVVFSIAWLPSSAEIRNLVTLVSWWTHNMTVCCLGSGGTRLLRHSSTSSVSLCCCFRGRNRWHSRSVPGLVETRCRRSNELAFIGIRWLLQLGVVQQSVLNVILHCTDYTKHLSNMASTYHTEIKSFRSCKVTDFTDIRAFWYISSHIWFWMWIRFPCVAMKWLLCWQWLIVGYIKATMALKPWIWTEGWRILYFKLMIQWP